MTTYDDDDEYEEEYVLQLLDNDNESVASSVEDLFSNDPLLVKATVATIPGDSYSNEIERESIAQVICCDVAVNLLYPDRGPVLTQGAVSSMTMIAYELSKIASPTAGDDEIRQQYAGAHLDLRDVIDSCDRYANHLEVLGQFKLYKNTDTHSFLSEIRFGTSDNTCAIIKVQLNEYILLHWRNKTITMFSLGPKPNSHGLLARVTYFPSIDALANSLKYLHMKYCTIVRAKQQQLLLQHMDYRLLINATAHMHQYNSVTTTTTTIHQEQADYDDIADKVVHPIVTQTREETNSKIKNVHSQVDQAMKSITQVSDQVVPEIREQLEHLRTSMRNEQKHIRVELDQQITVAKHHYEQQVNETKQSVDQRVLDIQEQINAMKQHVDRELDQAQQVMRTTIMNAQDTTLSRFTAIETKILIEMDEQLAELREEFHKRLALESDNTYHRTEERIQQHVNVISDRVDKNQLEVLTKMDKADQVWNEKLQLTTNRIDNISEKVDQFDQLIRDLLQKRIESIDQQLRELLQGMDKLWQERLDNERKETTERLDSMDQIWRDKLLETNYKMEKVDQAWGEQLLQQNRTLLERIDRDKNVVDHRVDRLEQSLRNEMQERDQMWQTRLESVEKQWNQRLQQSQQELTDHYSEQLRHTLDAADARMKQRETEWQQQFDSTMTSLIGRVDQVIQERNDIAEREQRLLKSMEDQASQMSSIFETEFKKFTTYFDVQKQQYDEKFLEVLVRQKYVDMRDENTTDRRDHFLRYSNKYSVDRLLETPVPSPVTPQSPLLERKISLDSMISYKSPAKFDNRVKDSSDDGGVLEHSFLLKSPRHTYLASTEEHRVPVLPASPLRRQANQYYSKLYNDSFTHKSSYWPAYGEQQQDDKKPSTPTTPKSITARKLF
jgi:hypothetical protein